MKHILALIAVLLMTGALFAQPQQPAQTDEDVTSHTLAKIAAREMVPVRKLVIYLGLPSETLASVTLADMKLEAKDLDAALTSYYASETLSEVAKDRGLPIKKLIAHFDEEIDPHKPLGEQGVKREQIDLAHEHFSDQIKGYILGITIAGMLVVFASLIVIGLIINQLRHLDPKNRQKKPEPTKTVAAAKSAPEPDVSTNAIIAVITALHLHVREAEEQRKLNLTWRRAPVSMWRAGKVTMPNREFVLTRRK